MFAEEVLIHSSVFFIDERYPQYPHRNPYVNDQLCATSATRKKEITAKGHD